MTLMRKLFPLTRRSSFLVLFGFAYCVIGWSYIIRPAPPNLRDELPLQAFGVLWLLCGLTAIVTGVLRWHKPFGFAALTFVGVLWGTVEFIGWLTGHSPSGWRIAVIFWLVSLAVHIVAGMADVRRR